MTITKCTITEKELAQAVENFLKGNGISLPVERVSKNYWTGGGYEIEFLEKPEPSPAVNQPEEVIGVAPDVSPQVVMAE